MSEIDTIAKVIAVEGWTCEYHEPDATCERCRVLHLRTAKSVVAALDELRSHGYKHHPSVIAPRGQCEACDAEWHDPARRALERLKGDADD